MDAAAPKGCEEHDVAFVHEGGERRVRVERAGSGRPLLVLPALSTVSTREEMRTLAEGAGAEHARILADWPGFGAAPREAIAYTPALLQAFADALLEQAAREEPADILVAGHGAAYAVEAARRAPGRVRRLALIAPTWRGPLPTAMGPHPGIYEGVRRTVRAPLVGPLLYRINTLDRVIALMYRRHVYADEANVTADLVRAKTAIAHAPNARFGSVAFVTGGLDPFPSREEFLAALSALNVPILAAIGEDTPPKSRAEMEAMAQAGGVRPVRLPGALGMQEECAGALIPLVRDFLAAPDDAAGDTAHA